MAHFNPKGVFVWGFLAAAAGCVAALNPAWGAGCFVGLAGLCCLAG